MAKKFMVIRYHKDENLRSVGDAESQLYNTYDEAFKAFDKTVTEETWEPFARPKGEEPLRATILWDYYLELWVISHVD